LVVSPIVSTYLRSGIWPLYIRWMVKYKCRIKITSTQSTGVIDTKFLGRDGKELE